MKTLAAFRENLQGASIALELLDLRWLSLLAGYYRSLSPDVLST